MLPGVPISNPPSQGALDGVLGRATRAEMVVHDERARVLGPEDLRALGRAVRLADAPPRWERDLPGNVEISPWCGGEDLGLLIVNPDLTVRWIFWNAACELADPAALGAWLSARGVPGPLAAFTARTSPDAADRRARFLALAPPALRPRLGELEKDPYAFDIPTYREALDAAAEALGGIEQAIWAACAWHGAAPGPWDRALPAERMADGLLRSVGVEDVLDLAARGVPEAARAGLCRFLVDNACTRFWALSTRLPEAERAALVRAAAATGEAENELRARQIFSSEGPLAPEGTRLLASAQNGAFRRACTDGHRAFVMDGRDIRRIDPTGEVRDLFTAYRPGTPLAVRGKHVWFLNPVDPVSVPVEGGERRDRRGLLLGFREVRFPWSYRRFREACDRAVERALPGADPDLVLDADRDQREAYVAFGGDLPAAMELSCFWACDAQDPRLLRISKGGGSQAIPLAGRPVAIGAQGDRVHVVIAREEAVAVVVVGRAMRPRMKRWIPARPEAVRGVVLVGDDVWLRLAAPLGDVLVAVEGPDLDG